MPTTAVATTLGTETIAVACGASTGSRSAVKNVAARGDPRSSIGCCVEILDAGRAEAGKPASNPTGEKDRSAQRRPCSKSLRYNHPHTPLSPRPPILDRRVPTAKYIVIFW